MSVLKICSTVLTDLLENTRIAPNASVFYDFSTEYSVNFETVRQTRHFLLSNMNNMYIYLLSCVLSPAIRLSLTTYVSTRPVWSTEVQSRRVYSWFSGFPVSVRDCCNSPDPSGQRLTLQVYLKMFIPKHRSSIFAAYYKFLVTADRIGVTDINTIRNYCAPFL